MTGKKRTYTLVGIAVVLALPFLAGSAQGSIGGRVAGFGQCHGVAWFATAPYLQFPAGGGSGITIDTNAPNRGVFLRAEALDKGSDLYYWMHGWLETGQCWFLQDFDQDYREAALMQLCPLPEGLPPEFDPIREELGCGG